MALITLGALYGPGVVVGVTMFLILPAFESQRSLLFLGLGIECVIGSGVLVGGLALRRWHRWRKVLGVILTIVGALEASLASVGFLPLFVRLQTGRELNFAPTATHAGVLAAVVGPLLLILGIWLIRRQKKIDRAAEGGDPLREYVKDRGPRGPAPELVASVREQTESGPRL